MRTILKRAAWVVLSLTILFSFPPRVFCQAAGSLSDERALSLQEYIAELDRCSAILNSPQHDPAAFRELRATLPAQWVVQAGEQHYTVGTGWLSNALAALASNTHEDNPLLIETWQKLAALRSAAERLEEPTPAYASGLPQARLDRILSAREFQGVRGPSWFDVLKARVYDWIWRQIERFLKRFGISRSIGGMIAWILIGLSVLLMVFWVVRFFIRGAAQPEMDLEGASRPGKDWRDWLRAARTAAERGDYRAAIHAAYWAAVARLEESNLLPQDRSRTPRESLRLIRRESAEYAPLAQLTRRFELVWYGYRSATETDWGDAIQQLEKLGCLPSSTPAIAAS
ncbi:MAG: DUF4129 domain-containing protein [Candidatus Acidiferrales bacterium]